MLHIRRCHSKLAIVRVLLQSSWYKKSYCVCILPSFLPPDDNLPGENCTMWLTRWDHTLSQRKRNSIFFSLSTFLNIINIAYLLYIYFLHLCLYLSVWFLYRVKSSWRIKIERKLLLPQVKIKMYLVRADRANRENYIFLFTSIFAYCYMYIRLFFSRFPLAIFFLQNCAQYLTSNPSSDFTYLYLRYRLLISRT